MRVMFTLATKLELAFDRKLHLNSTGVMAAVEAGVQMIGWWTTGR